MKASQAYTLMAKIDGGAALILICNANGSEDYVCGGYLVLCSLVFSGFALLCAFTEPK